MSGISWVIHRQQYQQIANKIEPAARLSTKESWLWKVIAAVLMVVTFGGMGYRQFLDQYAITLGPLQAYPAAWTKLSTRLLVHECTHTTWCVWLGWLIPIAGWFFGRRVRAWCGLLPFGLLYLLVFLPFVVAYGRYRAELHADVVAWRWALANGYDASMVELMAAERAETVCGGSYGWSWPKPLGRRGYSRAATKVIAQHGKEGS